jgi:hypothetical protein
MRWFESGVILFPDVLVAGEWTVFSSDIIIGDPLKLLIVLGDFFLFLLESKLVNKVVMA